MIIERARPTPPLFARFVLRSTLLILFLPLIALFAFSIIVRDQNGGFEFSLHWYQAAIGDSVLWPAVMRSLIVATTASILSTILGLFAALMLGKWNVKGRGVLTVLSSLSLTLPELVLALSLLSWFALIGLELSLMTVIIAHITLTLPFSTLVVSARLRALENQFDDAARDLGATETQIFTKVLFPLLKPALLNSFLLCFLLSFDDFLITFFTSGVGSDTLPVTLYASMKSGLSPKLHALSVMILMISASLCFALLSLRKKRN
jgi:spermidine/putrescine transport system permease protein